jgi:hypothetical protein
MNYLQWITLRKSYSPILFIRQGTSQVQFCCFAMSQFDWPITKKTETVEAPEIRRYVVQTLGPLAQL